MGISPVRDSGTLRSAIERRMITDLKAKRIAPGDRPMSDGTVVGLRLEPGSARGRGKWILRFVSPVTHGRRDMGLGAYPEVSIADARDKGMAARRLIAAGKDPVDERNATRALHITTTGGAMTFEQAARQVHADQKAGWKPKHADLWIKTLEDYVFPAIGAEPVAGLTPAMFAEVLRPIWLTKPETASRVKQRCHTVMQWCLAHGLVTANPVDVVHHLLPQQPGPRDRTHHQPAMPWRDLPAFVHSMRYSRALAWPLLEFVILTAARSGEARAMTWYEIDLDARVWTVPASRMKAGTTHRIPLSARAVEILMPPVTRGWSVENLGPSLVFPSPRGLVLSDMALTKFLRDHNIPSSEPGRIATAHGFRSSFRDWASENGYPRDLAERALAHTIANQSEAAYHRTDLLEQRRPMMEAWAEFVGGRA